MSRTSPAIIKISPFRVKQVRFALSGLIFQKITGVPYINHYMFHVC